LWCGFVAYSIVLLPMQKVFGCSCGNPNPNRNRIQCKLLFSLPYCVHSFIRFVFPPAGDLSFRFASIYICFDFQLGLLCLFSFALP